MTQGTHENKNGVKVEFFFNNMHLSGIFNFNSDVTYGWSPKCLNLPKVKLKKFDGIEVFTWVNHI